MPQKAAKSEHSLLGVLHRSLFSLDKPYQEFSTAVSWGWWGLVELVPHLQMSCPSLCLATSNTCSQEAVAKWEEWLTLELGMSRVLAWAQHPVIPGKSLDFPVPKKQ